MRSLVWFRSDLRLTDNPALLTAAQRGEQGCIGIFLTTPGQWKQHDWGPAKVDFLLRNLKLLSAGLSDAGIPLLVREVDDFEGAAAELERLAVSLHCDGLFFNREYEVNERRRDADVTERFKRLSLSVEACDDQTIVPPGELLTTQGRAYSVFTPFKRRWTAELLSRGFPDLLARPPKRDLAKLPKPDPVPKQVAGFESQSSVAELWPAGEEEAQARLTRFIDERVSSYDESRDIPAADLTSRLSPYLALGVISIRACLAAALAANEGALQGGSPGLESWISELVWREFYRHVIVGFPRVSKGRCFRREGEKVQWLDPHPKLDAWCEGRTGVPFVDAGMRQLLHTGWMHNRLRMITAMFLTKDLLIDWRHGERFFMQRLIDADLANNNGGWQWAASTGTDAAPYFRIFNPWAQARRFDPNAAFIKQYVPQLRGLDSTVIHDPERLCAAGSAAGDLDYPPPIVDHSLARVRAIEAFEVAKTPS